MPHRHSQSHPGLITAASLIGLTYGIRTAVRLRRHITFAGKTVLITGGSRGLGLVLARKFAEERANVAICARDERELTVARDELRSYGVDVLGVQCDVSSRQQVTGMIDGLTRHFGTIDVLINNAGTISVGPMETMTLADFEEAMQTHFWAPLYTSLAVLPQMKARQSGRIVNISSIGGKIAVPHLLPYSASKFALVGFSEGLRAELIKDNVYVTTVCPGLMRTGSPRNAFFKGRHRDEYSWFVISDSLPPASVSAETAARRIIRACRYGQAETMVSFPSWVATRFHGLFPGLTSELNSYLNYMLPTPGGIGTDRAPGKASETDLTRSSLTALTQEAAVANNEVR
jgi:short-subunit dehydrogenase